MSRVPSILSLEEVQQSFRDMWALISPLLTGNLNMKGRRIINLGAGTDSTDAATVAQALSARIDVFANRGQAAFYPNQYFTASDRNYLTWLSNGTNWVYAYGRYKRTQAQLSALASTLTSTDALLEVEVTDYSHVLRWTASVWEFHPLDDGSNYFRDAETAPNRGTWQLCDGTTVNVLNGDGTTSSIVTRNLTGHHRKSVAASPGLAAAIAPGISGSTATEAAHTHGVTITSGAPSATATVDNTLAGSTTTVGNAIHTHVVNGNTGAGSAHLHAVGTLAVDATGEPAVYKVLTYLRR